jgi:hypothetical protein
MAILTSSDQAVFFPNVTATGDELEGLIFAAQAMCESTYGADRPLDVYEYSDVVPVYSSGIAFIKRSPLIDVSAIVVRRSPQDDWQSVDSAAYGIDYDTCQVNFKYLPVSSSSNFGSLRNSSTRTEARIVYTSGFDFSTDTTQEANNIRSVCGKVVTYMKQPIAIGESAITNADGFQSYVPLDNYLSIFLAVLTKYKPRG